MKSLQFARFLIPIFLLMLAQPAYSQGTTHEVVLYVNTGEIQNPNVNDYCNFGQDPEIPNEEYTITTSVGDFVVWRGQSTSNPNDMVVIESINHEGDKGGRDIFGQNRLPGENGVVTGRVLNGTENGVPYKYKLTFRILSNGEERGGVFNIDPKIIVR
ncbi:hypothetical protein [Robiginitalea sp. SC105]|uniref:hypothetical protein n=1 Tax=Robiginitalea sp. SC105 TaxID=2762332 RepID=UPI00163A088C|nr:hypothetical protein [Robiginitalea sp. SC105]MBC2839925.1 hypothetical protein [Robiginitalea sp. SC105]